MRIGEYLHNLFGHLPPWAYVAIIGGGIAAAVVLPKFFGGTGNQTTSSNGSDTTAAIDPNTGLPYPISGYPGGAFAGSGVGGANTTGATNDGQQASQADTAALLAALNAIATRLSASPVVHTTTSAQGTTKTSTKKAAAPVAKVPLIPEDHDELTTAKHVAVSSGIHVSAQPSTQSIASAVGSSQPAYNAHLIQE
jgi:hypothetical protein